MASRVLLPRLTDPVRAIVPVPQLNTTYHLYPAPAPAPVQDPSSLADKNHRKVLRNRMNSQLSREKKRKYVEDLEDRVKVLETKNRILERKVVQLEETNSTLQSMLATQQAHVPVVYAAAAHSALPADPSSPLNPFPTDFDPNPTVFDFLAELGDDDSTMEVSTASSSDSSPTLTSASAAEVDLPEFSLAESHDEEDDESLLMFPATQPVDLWTNLQASPGDTSSLMDSDDSSSSNMVHSRSDSDADSIDYFFSSSDDEQQLQEVQQEPPAQPQVAQQQQQLLDDGGEVVLDQGQAVPLMPPGPLQSPAFGPGDGAPVSDTDVGGGLQQQQQSTGAPPGRLRPSPTRGQSGEPGQSWEGRALEQQSQSQPVHGHQVQQDALQREVDAVADRGAVNRDNLINPLISSLDNLAGLTEQLAPSFQQLASMDDPAGQSDEPQTQWPQTNLQDDSGLAQSTQQLADHVHGLTLATQQFIQLPIYSANSRSAGAPSVSEISPRSLESVETSRSFNQSSFLEAQQQVFGQDDFAQPPLLSDLPSLIPRSWLDRYQPGELDQSLTVSFQRAQNALSNFRLVAGAEQPDNQAVVSDATTNDRIFLTPEGGIQIQVLFQQQEANQRKQTREAKGVKKYQIQLLVSSFHSQLSQLLQFVLQMAALAGLAVPHIPGQGFQGLPRPNSPRSLIAPSSPALLVF